MLISSSIEVSRWAKYQILGLSLRSEACNFIKKETLAQVFSFEFYEIFKNTFFTEHLWTTAAT